MKYIGGYMESKSCAKCGCKFEKTRKKQSWCPPCKRQYDRDYHAARPPETKARKRVLQVQRIDVARQFIWDYFKQHPCEECGEADPIVLEFDHVDRESKDAVISEMSTYSLERIKVEIGKCRVLCANCHRRHTAIQLGWYERITR